MSHVYLLALRTALCGGAKALMQTTRLKTKLRDVFMMVWALWYNTAYSYASIMALVEQSIFAAWA